MAVYLSDLDSKTLLEFQNTVVNKEYIELLLKIGRKVEKIYTINHKLFHNHSKNENNLEKLITTTPGRGEKVIVDL